ncbi:hypothetical protein C2S52_008714 [Perilla frutescens var. hirtella]|uniref:Uncharacterized protein n=1 Tax=Perilla frutescens var. hirtella TaxID=608512 RepID=A0AAD4PE83_PERFH|nr:hypothetical protein C2S51_038758 [Perilla frutescens var. frutescens]KAH6783755.1 hypothetical protein C2S52_008714 [Perilla frutescens var. hirtella]KAH6835870.1 hypothetical protein C2S53_012552 [Perilla frutescens var. hirtella]
MASSPPPTGTELAVLPPAAESQLSSLVYDISQNLQVSMDTMLKMISEIDHNSGSITEEIEKSKESVLQRKIQLEEKKENLQKTTFAVFDMLNSRDTS